MLNAGEKRKKERKRKFFLKFCDFGGTRTPNHQVMKLAPYHFATEPTIPGGHDFRDVIWD